MAGAAHAGRPFVTEDAGVLGRGACEFEGMAGRTATRTPAGRTNEHLWVVQAGCGVGYNSQLAVGYGRSHADGERAHGHALGGKTALLQGDDDKLALSLAWGLNWARTDATTTFDTGAANLAVSRTFGAGWTLNANLGLLRVHQPRDTLTTWALALENRVAEGLDLGAEIYGEGHGKPWFGLGLRWQLAESWSLNASAAVHRETRAAGEAARVKLFSVGFKFEF